jgi:hypothetical protein
MTILENSTPESIFASIDERSENFVDDSELARNFTHMVINRATDFSESVEIEMVHLSEGMKPASKDFEGKIRCHAIWKENQNYFGAWVFLHEDRMPEPERDEIIYPHILGPVTKKSQEIVEDVYYIEKLGLPVAWVTYHNAQ